MAPRSSDSAPSSPPRRGRAIGVRARGPARRGASTRGTAPSSGPSGVGRAHNHSTYQPSVERHRPSEPSMFAGASHLDIEGGDYSISGHRTNVTINLNQGQSLPPEPVGTIRDFYYDGIERPQQRSVPVRLEEEERSQAATWSPDTPQQPWRRPSLPEQRICEIYYRQLVVKGRGSPLWVPAPNTELPLPYRRKGISIGDVGIITNYGGFDFLFNIYLPAGHPGNPDELPEDFVPLTPSLMPNDVRGYSYFPPGSYLASSSVEKSRRGDSDPSGLVFELSAAEGAVLTMPQGAKSTDLGSTIRFWRYATMNAERWYRYAHNVRAIEAQNGDLRLVTGWDQSTTWGMAAFAKTTSQNVNGIRLKFKPDRSGAGAVDARQTFYGWEYESATIQGRVGPNAAEIEALRAGDPEEENAIYENQCLFLRTLNVTLADGVWDKLISETDMRFVINNLTNTHPSPSLLSRSSSYSVHDGGGSQSMGQSQNLPDGSKWADSVSPSSYSSVLPTALTIHPSKSINERLLKDNQDARMVITEDQDWISVLKSDDLEMPSGEELYERILASRDICEEDGILSLEPKGTKLLEPKPINPPRWAISKCEIDCEKQIGAGLFSAVYTGTWQGRVIATRILHQDVPEQLFSRSMDVWTNLDHPNVISTYGGSNPAVDKPFFVISPYMKAGTLVQYLREMDSTVLSSLSGLHDTPFSSPRYWQKSLDEGSRDAVLLRTMDEIAQGMEYLHTKGVLHGDLRAANVLVDDDHTCLVADFGQKELKDEVNKRAKGANVTTASIRWSSPEYISGSILTDKVDVYAFAITCTEILMMGHVPWPFLDDASVRKLLLQENARPPLSKKVLNNVPALRDIVHQCCQTLPDERPTFSKIVLDLGSLRNKAQTISSPRVSPVSSPRLSPVPAAYDVFLEVRDVHSRKSSKSSIVVASESESRTPGLANDALDEEKADFRDEKRFRISLIHRYHPSLVLPLWEPSSVEIGAVGYLQKPAGRFITLFNAFSPQNAAHEITRSLPSISAHGEAKIDVAQSDKRPITKRVLDRLPATSMLKSLPRGSFPLQAGKKSAHIYAEDAEYQYMHPIETPTSWFQATISEILRAYQEDHQLSKEDIFLVTGLLRTPKYGLFVSRSQHCDADLSFNVDRPLKKGKPWGAFTADGDNHQCSSIFASKVATHGDPSKAILLSRLRFKPDNSQPTQR